MKLIPEGTLKFLLIDGTLVTRNAERAKPGEPVAVVIEVAEDGTETRHTGFGVYTAGTVGLAYEQRGFVCKDGRLKFAAAYNTRGEVRIATERGEDLLTLPEEKPASNKKGK